MHDPTYPSSTTKCVDLTGSGRASPQRLSSGLSGAIYAGSWMRLSENAILPGTGVNRGKSGGRGLPAALLARSQPHRGGLRQAQGAAAQSRGAYPRGARRGDRPSAGGGDGEALRSQKPEHRLQLAVDLQGGQGLSRERGAEVLDELLQGFQGERAVGPYVGTPGDPFLRLQVYKDQ